MAILKLEERRIEPISGLGTQPIIERFAHPREDVAQIARYSARPHPRLSLLMPYTSKLQVLGSKL